MEEEVRFERVLQVPNRNEFFGAGDQILIVGNAIYGKNICSDQNMQFKY